MRRPDDASESHLMGEAAREDAIEYAIDRGEPLRLVTLVGGYRHKQIKGRPLMMELGNPAVILLLAYLLTLPGIILEFFMLKSFWYFGFDLYSLYVFLLAAGCVIAGFYLVFRRSADGSIGIGNLPLFAGSLAAALLTVVILVQLGGASPELSILLSVIIMVSLILTLVSARNISSTDAIPVTMYGIGGVIMTLVPVHQAFGIWGGGGGVLEFTLFDGILVVVGISIALTALNRVRGRTGLFACWLLGAVIITLVAFHEIAAIVSSQSFEIYDQVLALEGAVLSIVPLSLYIMREIESARLWTNLINAKMALDRKNYERALIEVEKAMERISSSGLSGKVSLPWGLYGDIYYRMGKLNRAKTCYDMALQINQNDVETLFNLGNMLAVKGYGEQALAAFQKAASLKPQDANIWNNLGVVLLSMRKYDEALAAFDRAIERDAVLTTAYYNAGMILLRSGRPSAAVKYLDKLLELAPDEESYRRAYDRNLLIMEYFQQVAGWKLLDFDVSELVKTVIQNPGKFESTHREFMERIVRELSVSAFGGDRDRTNEVLQDVLLRIKRSGESLSSLEAESGLTPDQLRLCVAILILANRAKFRRIGDAICLVTRDEGAHEGGATSARPESRSPESGFRKPSTT